MKIFLLSALLFLAQRPETQPPVSEIVVTGTAQILAAPDEATVRLGVVRQSNVAQTAQDQANAVAQEILNAVGKTGVTSQQIQTSRLVLTPIYAPRIPESREPPRLVSYTAANTISIRVDNLAMVGTVIDAGLKAGANQLEGVQFGLRNDLTARQQALKQAVTEARSKAETMADALRVNLGAVIEATEGGVTVIPRPVETFAMARATIAQTVETPVSVGELEVRASVTVRYRISPK